MINILIADIGLIQPDLAINGGNLAEIAEGDTVSVCASIALVIEPDVKFLLAYAGDIRTGEEAIVGNNFPWCETSSFYSLWQGFYRGK